MAYILQEKQKIGIVNGEFVVYNLKQIKKTITKLILMSERQNSVRVKVRGNVWELQWSLLIVEINYFHWKLKNSIKIKIYKNKIIYQCYHSNQIFYLHFSPVKTMLNYSIKSNINKQEWTLWGPENQKMEIACICV